jgi:hypothetical protein
MNTLIGCIIGFAILLATLGILLLPKTEEPCPSCNGSGIQPGFMDPCRRCNGSGHI